MQSQCGNCGRILPVDLLVEVSREDGTTATICRDSMGCLYHTHPWKNPNLPADERERLRATARAGE